MTEDKKMRDFIVVLNFTCAIISGKWAMDLGVSQARQLLFAIGGLVLGPFMLLILYIYLLYKARREGEPGGKIV